MRLIAPLIALIVVLVVGFSSAFIVDETEQGFVTRFGKPITGAITNAGLRFKVPLIDKARIFDQRFLEWDGDPSDEIPTRDQRFISIDTYARWRIEDPIKFYQTLNSEREAQSRLDDILDSATRTAIARHDLVDVIRSNKRVGEQVQVEGGTNVREVTVQDPTAYGGVKVEVEEGEVGTLEPFAEDKAMSDLKGRKQIAREIYKEGVAALEDWGIELLDLRLKRINYAPSVQQEIFSRMISEREKVASEYRSEGEGEAARIEGQMERDLEQIRSAAEREAQAIRGRADAAAVNIYAKAYDQSQVSREFYEFQKTLEAYTNTLSGRDRLILSTKSDFYRYLRSAHPGKSSLMTNALPSTSTPSAP